MADIYLFKNEPDLASVEHRNAMILSLRGIINELLTTALRQVAVGDVAEYDIQTGQTTNRVKLSSMKEVQDTIENYTRLLNLIESKKQPRVVRLLHDKNWR